MTDIETLKARMEALAHASAVLLADRLAGLEPSRAAQACAAFAQPFAIQQDASPRRGVMLEITPAGFHERWHLRGAATDAERRSVAGEKSRF